MSQFGIFDSSFSQIVIGKTKFRGAIASPEDKCFTPNKIGWRQICLFIKWLAL
jgi:hypothetical protein